jgi:3-phenylpropionate/trans-cinnamate dioxygenase ferredoxin subunit
MSPKYIKVARTVDLKDNPMKVVEVPGKEILITLVDANYYTTLNRCPHMVGNLSHGKLEGTTIKCSAHGRRFDIRDGRVQGHSIGKLLMRIDSDYQVPFRNLLESVC